MSAALSPARRRGATVTGRDRVADIAERVARMRRRAGGFPVAMMTSIDTREIAKRLHGAGLDKKQAGAIAAALRDGLKAKQVSPDDADLSRLANKDDIAALRSDLRAEMAALRTELKSEIELLRRDLTIRLGGMIVVLGGFLEAIKFPG